jgi:formate dehydrogenase subunit delta
MDIHHLVKNANNIASFFESEPDRAKGEQAIATHLRNFWEPRMRREILRYLDESGGTGLKPIVIETLRAHRGELTPAK